MDFLGPIPSKDGKKLFVVGSLARAELARYDLKSHQFVPFMSGISAEALTYSKDGQWVTYTSIPEGNLFRSRVDGSEKLQLTFPPVTAYEPRWSPDGKRIAFQGSRPGQNWRMYLISADGGEAEELMTGIGDLGWSPDGKSLIFHSGMEDLVSTSPRAVQLMDLKTRKVSQLPGSEGFYFSALVAGWELHLRAPGWCGGPAVIRCAHQQVDQVGGHSRWMADMV